MSKGTLLIVDDEEDITSMLSRYFKLEGYEVLTSNNGHKALEILSQKKIDVMISDIMMPEMSGLELIKEVRKDYPMVRIIMITGHVTLTNLLSCLAHQTDTVVFKPFDNLDEIEEAVERGMSYLHMWRKKLHELKGIK